MVSSKLKYFFAMSFVFVIFIVIGIFTVEDMNQVFFEPSKLKCQKYICENSMKKRIWEKFSIDTFDLMKDMETAKQLTSKMEFLVAINNIEKKFSDLMRNMESVKTKELKIDKPVNSDVELDVCPELYTNTTFGQPVYHRGWEITNCKKKPFAKVLSIVLNVVRLDSEFVTGNLFTLLKNIASGYPGLNVYIASKNSLPEKETKKINLNINLFVYHLPSLYTDGSVLNFLISKVGTPYVFIANDVNIFYAEDARLERLVRELGDMDIYIAGGASRNSTGHWEMNCQQAIMRNYSLLLRSGYAVSAHECVFCDIVSGPFAAKTEFMKRNQFNSKASNEMVIYDFFLSQYNKKRPFVVCPDSMMYTTKHLGNGDKILWTPIANKFGLYSIKTVDDNRMTFSCDEVTTDCNKVKSKAISPCCLKELSDLIKFVMSACEKNGVVCELCEGSALSAIKMKSVFPWEIDSDVNFLSRNFSKLVDMKSYFSSHGYKMQINNQPKVTGNSVNGGAIVLFSKNWFLELWGMTRVDSSDLHDEGLPPTRVYLDGQWVQAGRNPGRVARNRYGHEVYRHVEHWRRLGQVTGFYLYNPTGFLKCSDPGHHSCLDQYNSDGNLQFGDVTL